MTITLYHNARCSKSRATLQILQSLEDSEEEIEIINYLESPPSVDELKGLLRQLDMRPAELMRTGESVYKQLGLDNSALPENELIQAMVDNPILINRPIVVTNNGARLCRPPERIHEILD